MGGIEIEVGKCKGCGLCVGFCKRDVLEMSSGRMTNKKGYHFPIVRSEEECVGCGDCYEMCGDDCIGVYVRGG